jgi:hypothetical protein
MSVLNAMQATAVAALMSLVFMVGFCRYAGV